AIVGLPEPLPPGQPVSGLHIVGDAVRDAAERADAFVVHVSDLGDYLRILARPHQVAGRDPFAIIARAQRDLVPISRSAPLQAMELVGLDEQVDQPRAVVVDVAEIAAAADHGAASITDPGVIV